MADYSTDVRNAQLDALETEIGASPILRIYTGSAPANAAAASTGTLLCEMTLPADWLTAAASGSKALAGTWSGTNVATGTAGYFRIFDSGDSQCHVQGSVSEAGGGGEMVLASTSLTLGETITINAFTFTGGNA